MIDNNDVRQADREAVAEGLIHGVQRATRDTIEHDKLSRRY